MTADEVAQYLQANPGFFEDYHELLAHLVVPHPHGGRTISITERQILTLREKSRQLESKLVELVRYGEENDAISDKVHAFSTSIAVARDAESVLMAVRNCLLNEFRVPFVAIRVWGVNGLEGHPDFEDIGDYTRAYASTLRHPYCGPNSGFDASVWFGPEAELIRSIALVPLRLVPGNSELFGLLALGSDEPVRFYSEMGTVFLERIGELVSANLMRSL